MDSKGPKFSRREILASSVVLPLVVARPGVVLARGASSESAPEDNVLPTAPKPDHMLRIAEKSIAPLGKPTNATLVNGMLPGPEIRYREGDMFRVVLQNNLEKSSAPDGSTTVHWHGLIVPCWMDGVPEITQLPIKSNESFYVEFPIVQTGTYWYHSHTGLQEQLGLSGPLIVEERSPEHAYDHDVTCMANDWLNQSPYDIVPQIRGEKPKTDAVRAPSGDLYNLPGAKSPFEVDVNYPGFLLNGAANDSPWTFKCAVGDRLRLRLINGATS
ncbi:MAG: multicopper oxidase domain-containing protein, partial [Myxococcota bacterium]